MEEIQKLPGDYIAGFVDGEGCFALKFIRSVRHDRPNKPIYFYWAVEFIIALRIDDRDILEKIQTTLDCGKISIIGGNQARYYISLTSDLKEKVIPFFENYPLRAKKSHDFELWKEAVDILSKNAQIKNQRVKGHWGFTKSTLSENDFNRLVEIYETAQQYKSSGKTLKWLAEFKLNVGKC